MYDSTQAKHEQDAYLVSELQEIVASRFGARIDRTRLERAISETATVLMSRPARITNYFPDLTINQVSGRLAQ